MRERKRARQRGTEAVSRKALLVIDMVRDFVEPDGRLFVGQAASGVIRAIAAHIADARAQGWPIVYVCDRHAPDDPEFAMFASHCIAGTAGAEIVAQLCPQPGDRIIPKRRYSAFFQTDLDLTLRELGVDEIVLTGVCTNICDLYTAADARMLGYRVVVPRDCVASFDAAAHEFALREMERTLGVQVV